MNYKLSMKISLKLLLFLFLIIVLACAAQCPSPSHFDFTGRYTIGKQDQLNRTFTYIQSKITSLPNVTYNATQSTSYTIFNAKPTFSYRDSTQKGKILGNDTIVIFGGKLFVDIAFDFIIKRSLYARNGTGAASGLSDAITFAKQVYVQNNSFISFQLLDYQDVAWSESQPFKLRRVQPADITEDDKIALTRLLNNILQVDTVRTVLQKQLDRIYSYYLGNSLHDEHFHIDDQFDYIWVPGFNKPNITMSFKRRAINIEIQEEGIDMITQIQIENASDWKCGKRNIPLLHLNPKVYGGIQQFVSYDFYENVLRQAISKNYLNSDLNPDLWTSRMFQFFAGDLYEAIPQVQNKWYASEPVTGNCKANYRGLNVWKNTRDTFNVSFSFDCQLNIKRQKIVDIGVSFQMIVQGLPQEKTIDFFLRGHEEFIYFYPYGIYKTIDIPLATKMVSNTLSKLYEGKLFGSGFPQSPPKDYAHMVNQQNYTTVYDSTHVDSQLLEE